MTTITWNISVLDCLPQSAEGADYKEQIIDLPNALETVSKLKPRQFNWRETGNTMYVAAQIRELV